MRRIVRSRVDSWLLLGTAVGLFGCPLLLDDQFSTVTLSEPDPEEACIGAGCVLPSDGVGGRSGAGAGGSSASSGNAGSAGTAGTTSSAGSAGSGASGGVSSIAGAGGSAGSGGAAGAGGSTGQGGAETACRTLELASTNYGSASNCMGVHGSSNVFMDTGTTLELSYENGDPCFTGTISSSGWGAVYELTFADEDDDAWDASGVGVTGFEFAYRGIEQPPSLRVIYKDPSGVDNCHVIGSGTTAVPFSIAHPGCDDSGGTVDTNRLEEMILAFLPRTPSYDVDFCVQIRALD